jgi:HEAT repeat protein
MLTVGMIALTMMVASFVDYQFKIISRESFTETADLTAFLGTFYGRLSLVSFFLQFFLAQRLLRFIGVGRVIMFLPIGLLLGSAAMFVMPGLIAAVLLRGTDGAIKYSLDKTSRELLFLPIPPEIKKRTKLFIDLFVDRWFRGFAGALLLLCTLVFDMSIAQLSLVVIAMIVVWLALTLLMRKEYVNSFRRAVEKREIDLDDIKTHINDVSTVNTLIISLGSANERQVVYALDMLQSVKDIDLVEPTIPLLRHSSAEVRLKALELLNLQGTIAQAGEVENLLDDDNMDIRQQAVRFLCRTSDDAAAKLKELLTASDRRIQYAAIACLAKDGEIPADPTMVINIVTQVLDDKSAGAEEGRIQVAMLLGYHSIPNSDEYLERLLGDSSVHVVIEAMNSLGRLGNRRHVPWLLDKLPDRRFRAQAVASLACYGASILGTLNDHLRDSHVLFSIRKTIPRIMSRIPVQETVSALTRNLEQVEPPLKFYVVKALNNLRSKYSHLKFDAEVFKTATINEMKEYYEIFQVLQLQDVSDSGPSSLLLRRALDERLQQNLERVFRLLGLVYPPRDIYNAYHGVVSGKRILQANAVEFLDNLLNPDVKKCILPMLDDVAAETVLRKANELFQLNRTTREEGHVYLIGGSDTWLRCCAIYDAADSESQEVCDLVKTATHDPDPMVRETATMTLALK